MKKILLLALLCAINVAQGQIPKPQKKTFVNDYAGILTPADVKSLNQKIYKIQKDAGVQLAVVLVKEIPANYNIKNFANQIGKKWHVGTKMRGMVYVAAIKPHKQQLVVAKNLRSVFTSEKSESILAGTKNAYRNGDYVGGLTILVNEIHNNLVPEAALQAAKPVVQQAEVAAPKGNKEDANFDFIVGLGTLILIIFLIVRYFNKRAREKNAATAYRGFNNPNFNAGNQRYNGNGYNSNGNYPNYGYNGDYQPDRRSGSGVGSFIAGAALGAAGGYAARAYQDRDKVDANHPDNLNTDSAPVNDSDVTDDNNSNNWGNWGSGEPSSSDSGFDSGDSSSYSDSDSGFSSGDSSSDSGFDSSSSDSDSSSGGSSDW